MQNIFLLLFLRRGGGGSAKMPTILHPGGVVAFCYPMTSHLSISSPVVGGCAAQEGGVLPTWCRKSHTLKYELRRVLDRKEEVDDEVVVAVASSVSSHGWRRRPSLRPSYLINYLLGSAHFLGTPITLLRRSYWLYGRPPASVEDGRPCRHTDRALTSQPQRPDWRKKKKESRIRNKKQKKIPSKCSVPFHYEDSAVGAGRTADTGDPTISRINREGVASAITANDKWHSFPCLEGRITGDVAGSNRIAAVSVRCRQRPVDWINGPAPTLSTARPNVGPPAHCQQLDVWLYRIASLLCSTCCQIPTRPAWWADVSNCKK